MNENDRPDPSPDAPAEGADDLPPPTPGSPSSPERQRAGQDADEDE